MTGFVSGFTFSLNRYRISTLAITTMNDQKFKITKPFDQTKINDEIKNIARLWERIDMNNH